MAAATDDSDAQSMEGRVPRSRRKPRSSSYDVSTESPKAGSVVSPSTSRTHSRSKNSSSTRRNRSTSDDSCRSGAMISSPSKKKSGKDVLSGRRESSRTSSRSREIEHQERSLSPYAEPRGESGNEKTPTSKGKSYSATRSSTSQKDESKGRKSSVLLSLHSFLEEGKEPTTPTTRRKVSGSQSVVSSASHRRLRSHTPSSPSVVGGAVMSREELRALRHLRSSSEDAVDRSRLDRVRPEKESPASSHRSKERRSRSTSLSKKDGQQHNRPSPRPRSDRTHTKNEETSEDHERDRKSSWWNLEAKAEGEGREFDYRSGSLRVSGSHNTAESTPRSAKQTYRRLSMTSSNGAEIPPGFPAAAVDQNIRTLHGSKLESTEVAEGASEVKNVEVLESTTKIRERRGSMSGGVGSKVTISPRTSLDSGDDIPRRRKREIAVDKGVATAAEESPHPPSSPRRGEKAKRSLRPSMSENLKSSVMKPARRSRSADTEVVSPGKRSAQKSVSSVRNENLPLSLSQSTGPVEKYIRNDPSGSNSNRKNNDIQREKSRHRSNRLESISPGRRRRKVDVDVKGTDVHSSPRDELSGIVTSTVVGALPNRNEEKPSHPDHIKDKLSQRSRSTDSDSSFRSKSTGHGSSKSPGKQRSSSDDQDRTGRRIGEQTKRRESSVRSKSPSKVGRKLSGELSDNLAKVSGIRTSDKPASKKGSGRSAISAPAISAKNSKEKKLRDKRDDLVVKKTKSKSNFPESPTGLSKSDLKSKNHDCSTNDRFHESMDSLDPRLLARAPSVHNVSSILEIYVEKDADGGSHGVSEENSNQKSTGALSSENYGAGNQFNKTTLSCESTQIESIAATFGAVSEPSSPSSSESSGTSPGSLSKSSTRVRWVELPLYDPKQLLLKSADIDGGNETCVTQPMEKLSSQARNLNPSPCLDRDDDKSKERPNLPLEAAFNRVESRRRPRGPRDERTVGTSATSKSGTTATSESTVKTTNMNPSSPGRWNNFKTKQPSKLEFTDPHDGHGSLTTSQLPIPDPSDGSSGSLSGLSRRSKGEVTDGSSSTLSDKRKTRRMYLSELKAKAKDKSGRKGGEAGDTTTTKRPDRREKVPNDGYGTLDSKRLDRREKLDEDSGKLDGPRRIVRAVVSKERISQKDDGSKMTFVRRGVCNDGQSCGEPTEEKYADAEGDHMDVRPFLKRIPSIEGRRKSYLPRKSSNIEIDESRGHKTSVHSSLDNFLNKAGDPSPVVKDENRSVHSAIHDEDRWRRPSDKKIRDQFARGVSRQNSFGVVKRPNELKRTFSDSNDNVSVISAPILFERHRPVVNLKKTQFSSKLNKLKVAF